MEHKQKPGAGNPGQSKFPKKGLIECGGPRRELAISKLLGYTYNDLKWLKEDPGNILEVAGLLRESGAVRECAAKLLSIATANGLSTEPAEDAMRTALAEARAEGMGLMAKYLDAALLDLDSRKGRL